MSLYPLAPKNSSTAHRSPFEMALSQLIINLRYALMSISLSQNRALEFTVAERLPVAYGITDEFFAVASH